MTTRRQWLATAGAFLAAFAIPSVSRADRVERRATRLVTRRNPGCSCCAKWADHMRAAGFEVDISDHEDLDSYKDSLGVPKDLRGCHTSTGEGFIFEGHIPAPVIQRFLKERPNAKGIAVAGMPAGSPGMDSTDPFSYDVIAFHVDRHWLYERITNS